MSEDRTFEEGYEDGRVEGYESGIEDAIWENEDAVESSYNEGYEAARDEYEGVSDDIAIEALGLIERSHKYNGCMVKVWIQGELPNVCVVNELQDDLWGRVNL